MLHARRKGPREGRRGVPGRSPRQEAQPPGARDKARNPRTAAGKPTKGENQPKGTGADGDKKAGCLVISGVVFSGLTALATAILAALTCAYVVATALLWRETRASVETANAALRIAEMSERPWVVVDSISTPRERPGAPDTYSIIFTNTGTIPALDGQVRISTSYAGSFEFVGGSLEEAEAKNMPLRAPNQRTELEIPYTETDGELDWRPSGPLYIVIGAYTYRDSTGNTRELRFCYSRDGRRIQEGLWDPCPEHNSST